MKRGLGKLFLAVILATLAVFISIPNTLVVKADNNSEGKNTLIYTVYDKYLDEDGNVEKIDTRLTVKLGKGEEYNYEALSPKGYMVVGDSKVSGKCNSNNEITFIYQKKSYNITVINELYDIDGETLVDRYEKTYKVEANEGYSIHATITKGNRDYELLSEGDYYEVANSDEVYTFKYRIRGTKVFVIDFFVDENGNIISSKTRDDLTFKPDEKYTVEAINYEGYDFVPDCDVSSFIDSDSYLSYLHYVTRKDKRSAATLKVDGTASKIKKELDVSKITFTVGGTNGSNGSGSPIYPTYIYFAYRKQDVESTQPSEGPTEEVKNGLLPSEDGNWYYYNNNNIDNNFTGIVPNENGWWYVKNGMLDFTAKTVAANEFGWWKITNGGVDFDYTGYASNEFENWYIRNGQVDFSYVENA